jgi:hypothetical protein
VEAQIQSALQDSVDFALSYAGEDVQLARALAQRLRELSLNVFIADEQRRRVPQMVQAGA